MTELLLVLLAIAMLAVVSAGVPRRRALRNAAAESRLRAHPATLRGLERADSERRTLREYR